MDNLSYNEIRGSIGWFIILTIIGLISLSILPLVTYYDPSINLELSHNIFSIDSTMDSNLQFFSNSLKNIVYLIWASLAFILLGFVGISSYLCDRFQKISSIFLFLGIFSLISIVIVIFYSIFNMFNVNDMSNVELASIGPLPIKYIYIPILFFILSTIFGGIYTKSVIPIFKTIKIKPKKEKNKEEIEEENNDESEFINEDLKFDEKQDVKNDDDIVDVDDKDEIEDWLNKQVISAEKEEDVEEENDDEDDLLKEIKEVSDSEIDDKKDNGKKLSPFKNKINKDVEEDISIESQELETEKIDDKKDTEISNSFEEALSTAIKKRGGNKELDQSNLEIKKEEKNIQKPEIIEEKNLNEEDKKDVKSNGEIKEKTSENETKNKIIKVRCPECKEIFSVEKKGMETKIKCPHCGKEGVAK